MIKKIILFIGVFVIISTVGPFLDCWRFDERIYFSPLEMDLKLIEAVHNDVGYAPNIARIFHNKAQLGAFFVFDSYLYFFDIRFLAPIFSLVGYVGIFWGFWYLFGLKNKFRQFIISLLLVLPFIEIFKLIDNTFARALIISVPYFVLSIFGIWQFLKSHKWIGVLVVLILVVLSVWYTDVFGSGIVDACSKV